MGIETAAMIAIGSAVGAAGQAWQGEENRKAQKKAMEQEQDLLQKQENQRLAEVANEKINSQARTIAGKNYNSMIKRNKKGKGGTVLSTKI